MVTEDIFNYDFTTVFNACKKALKNLNVSIETEDRLNKTITGRTGTSLLSWGEDIQVIFEKRNQYSTKIKVESSSSSQLFSWGKNDNNERDIIEKIKSLLNK